MFAASAICGFKRIEVSISVLRRNAYALKQPEPEIRADFIRILNEDLEPHHWYKARNYLLAAGLLCYLATKVWATYQSSGWILVNCKTGPYGIVLW